MSDEGFLARWSRRKANSRAPAGDPPAVPRHARDKVGPEESAPGGPPGEGEPGDAVPAQVRAVPIPTMADVSSLDIASDFKPFMQAEVDPGVRNAALRTLFRDPHFNVMDGLDIYIDDYGKPDPLTPGMLESLQQWQALSRLEAAARGPDEPARAEPPPEGDVPSDDGRSGVPDASDGQSTRADQEETVPGIEAGPERSAVAVPSIRPLEAAEPTGLAQASLPAVFVAPHNPPLAPTSACEGSRP